ncbi:MAG TPA: sigma-70 family RNA polymerase sigma factor [Ideonella sp.]|uniref:RNA polymerase sigma factor n=1 Tax=Ideonella sp. TaxID=1929293 RepID=UPI002E315FC5|nr:sigma-70 family RNA polymerase sigma factor [Ideonella sp.]HEX5683551.1 sigma-70 family RNA polymerase sigma factor [Ideonella sp.]
MLTTTTMRGRSTCGILGGIIIRTPASWGSCVDWNEISDGDLVRRCAAGDRGAWCVLVRRYEALVYTIPRRARLPDAAVDDVFQTTFLRLLEHLDRLHQPDRVREWLVTTAKFETWRQWREATRTEPASEEALESLADSQPLPEEFLAEVQTWHAVQRGLERLEQRCRQIIEWLYLAETPLSYDEVADRLGMPSSGLSPTRQRCLRKLRLLLENP